MAQNKTQHYSRTFNINENIVDYIDNGIIVLDERLEIYHYNRWLELHTNIKESDVIGKKISEIFDTINAKTLIRKIKTALRMQTPTFYTASTSKYLIPIKINQLKNSNFKYMQQDVSIIPFNNEKKLVALIFTDQTIMANTNALLNSKIAKIKDLNAQLLKERNTIDKRVLFFKFNHQRKIVNVSQALLTLLGHTKEELLNKDLFTCENFLLDTTLQRTITTAIEELKVSKFEESCLTHQNKTLYFKSTVVPEHDAHGKHIGFILFREDITNAKNLALSHEKLLTSSRSAAMGEMISMIAHQWRQPLSLINTVMATLKIKQELKILDEESIDSSLEKINNTTQYLSNTIDDFRDYFKPNKRTSAFSLYALFDTSIYFLKDEMTQHQIEYIIEIPENIEIISYKNELVQSIINLIKNSIDAFMYTVQEGKKIHITVEEFSSHIALHIEDNAGGIQSNILANVFDPYFSTKSKNGTGLGLYMCQKIITENLQGDIKIQSEGIFTKVTVELPYSI